MKKIKNFAVWIPLIGVFIMFYKTKEGRYNTNNFAGLFWDPWMMFSTVLTILYLFHLIFGL